MNDFMTNCYNAESPCRACAVIYAAQRGPNNTICSSDSDCVGVCVYARCLHLAEIWFKEKKKHRFYKGPSWAVYFFPQRDSAAVMISLSHSGACLLVGD